MPRRLLFVLLILIIPAYAQEKEDSSVLLQRVLERLDHLEQQNRQLVQEVTLLRQQVAAAAGVAQAQAPEPAGDNQKAPPLEQRVAVTEARTAEQAQTKVEAAHKYPIQLTGMVLFNAFSNTESRNSYVVNELGLLPNSYASGATMRQTLLGFDFQGPRLPGNGHVNGSLIMDFWSGPSAPGSNWLRLRHADISLDWTHRSFTIGQDKPLISPYAPDSLAEVGVPPLSGAGNLWYWLPQARYEERVALGSNSGIRGQLAVLQSGGTAYETAESQKYTYSEPVKPALEGRVAFWHRIDDKRRFEVAPGFHVSSIRSAGASVGSRIASLDWLITPSARLSITGAFFTGQNVAGLGSLGNGITRSPDGTLRAVHASGGWTQLAFPLTARLTLNIFSGLEHDKSIDLRAANIVHNWSYASNLMYHLNSNLVIGLEGLQMRTRSASGLQGVQNRYDLAFGYLF